MTSWYGNTMVIYERRFGESIGDHWIHKGPIMRSLWCYSYCQPEPAIDRDCWCFEMRSRCCMLYYSPPLSLPPSLSLSLSLSLSPSPSLYLYLPMSLSHSLSLFLYIYICIRVTPWLQSVKWLQISWRLFGDLSWRRRPIGVYHQLGVPGVMSPWKLFTLFVIDVIKLKLPIAEQSWIGI